MKFQMSRTRRATAAVVPILLLSAAGSVKAGGSDGAATGPGVSQVTVDLTHSDVADGQLWADAPVSLGLRPVVSLPQRTSLPHRAVAATSVADIPAVALAAYQRAAVVIDKADPGCHLDWELLAAIGRVESDHGSAHGSRLGSDGVARPGILGVPLDGRHGTALVRDTDAGFLDGDRLLDHGVGPMQILPSTWVATGVDGDADGQRDPQDVDDASLAAAVQLCFGDDDLATPAGRRAAVHRYNHSDSYVALVLAIRQRYLDHSGLSSLTSSVLSVRAYARHRRPPPVLADRDDRSHPGARRLGGRPGRARRRRARRHARGSGNAGNAALVLARSAHAGYVVRDADDAPRERDADRPDDAHRPDDGPDDGPHDPTDRRRTRRTRPRRPTRRRRPTRPRRPTRRRRPTRPSPGSRHPRARRSSAWPGASSTTSR